MTLNISLSPHIHTSRTTQRDMWRVVLAMMPALAVAIWEFGVPALTVTVVCLAAALISEWVITRYMLGRKPSLLDGSAVITGMLLAFNLPSTLPWWMAVIGAVVAIGIGKMSFGGLGRNIWNPALVGRVFLLISFPAAMTTWPTAQNLFPGWHRAADVVTSASSAADASTGATMLQTLKFTPDAFGHAPDYLGMMVGNMNGSLGEVGWFAILIGVVYLIIRRVITWHIPVSVIGSALIFSWVFGGNPLLDLFAGGLMLGACFMATDYVTSPMTPKGQLIYGVMIGFITIIIRRFGAYPEGVSFAILLANSVVPLINRYCRPAVFGERERRIMLKTQNAAK